MESIEQSTKQSTDSSLILDSSHSDYAYDDDFEELDTFIKEKSNDPSESVSKKNATSKGSARKDIYIHKGDSQPDTDTHVEKGQRESSGQIPMEKDKVKQKPNGTPTFDDLQSDDSEPEGEVLFTEDQQRAMMELMAQKHYSGDYTGDPPEYNVKERLKELNEELAKEPDPDDRQHKVGFKKELVDLVAPPPETSDDDDDSPRKTLRDEEYVKRAAGQESQDNKQQFVVERDGKFDIVGDHELSAEERAMFNIPDNSGSKDQTDSSDRSSGVRREPRTKNSSSSVLSAKENMQPQPPSRPRPNTATGLSRRSVHMVQSPRPQTAASNRSANSNHGAALQDFNYSSPYAMSSSEKERAQERARLREQQRKEEERRRKEEEEYRRQESEDAFQAWLQHKMEEDRRKRQEDEDRRRNGKDDKSKEAETDASEAKENEEAYRGWLKQKQAQVKREKLLKRREEQGIKETYYVRSREECDLAYKEWLKKKYTEFRQQRVAEKERQRSFMSMARRARKQQMIARAVRQSQAFRYTDIYGYRF